MNELLFEVDKEIRLILVIHEHAKLLYNLVRNNVDRLRLTIEITDRIKSKEDAENMISSWLRGLAERRNMVFGIWCHNELVGIVMLFNIDRHINSVELGGFLDSHFEGRGVMWRAKKFLIDFAFNHMGMNRISQFNPSNNERAIRSSIGLGFRQEGIMRDYEILNGKMVDNICFAMLRSDWDTYRHRSDS